MHLRIITVVVALASLAGFVPAMAGTGVRFGAEGGINHAMATCVWAENPFDLHPKLAPAWSAGATLDVPLGRRLSLATGARYIEYGDRWDLTFGDAYQPDPDVPAMQTTFKHHLVWRYVAVPALLRFRPIASRGLFVEAGPEVGYLIMAATRSTITGLGAFVPFAGGVEASRRRARPAAAIFERVGTYDATHAFQRWNLSMAGGAGYEFPLRGHTGLVELRYTHGLTDIAKSSDLVRRTRGLELLAGWRW